MKSHYIHSDTVTNLPRFQVLCVMCSFVEICKEAVLDKYGCSTRKHVEDGVCLPAMEEFLSRHVSRRYIHRVRIAVH